MVTFQQFSSCKTLIICSIETVHVYKFLTSHNPAYSTLQHTTAHLRLI